MLGFVRKKVKRGMRRNPRSKSLHLRLTLAGAWYRF